MTTPPHNVVGWFEIPVIDMDRAIKFYETVFEFKMERHPMGPLDMAWFPTPGGTGAMGALVKHAEWYKPARTPEEGVLIYFTAFSGDVQIELDRVEKAGGVVGMPKKLIAPDIGYMGAFIDSEGNRIAVHSRK